VLQQLLFASNSAAAEPQDLFEDLASDAREVGASSVQERQKKRENS
jgi:hypothetical protein